MQKAYKSSFSEKVFLGYDPSKSNRKKFDVCRIFLMSALITLAKTSMNWAHAFLWDLPVTNFKPLLCCSLIKSRKSKKSFFYCNVKSCSYQSRVAIFGCIFDTRKYYLLVSFQINWCCLLTCCWLILIFLECLLCPVIKQSCSSRYRLKQAHVYYVFLLLSWFQQDVQCKFCISAMLNHYYHQLQNQNHH